MKAGYEVNFNYVLEYQATYSDCGVVTLAAFCPADNTVYINVEAVTSTSENLVFPLFVAAHETAHAIQWNLGIGGMNSGAVTIGTELQADCLAGDALSWMFSKLASVSGEEYKQMEYLVGLAAAQVGDYDYHNSDHHGTPEQRVSFALRGFTGENFQACLR
jgi:predicted metalloprotease